MNHAANLAGTTQTPPVAYPPLGSGGLGAWWTYLTARPALLVATLVVGTAALIWATRRVRAIVRSERPDDALSNLAMLVGLGWSSEGVWYLTSRLDLPVGLRLLLFTVLEVLLIVSMIRAKRHVAEHGWPGQAGTTAWIIAAAMGTVGVLVGHTTAEKLLRLAIPLLLVKQWWDGLVPDAARRPDWVTSWRWTPRRLLLWLGALEPGERDVDTVHRDRLIQQMTNLEHRRRNATGWWQRRHARRLSRMSLKADGEIIDAVRCQVGHATWWTVTPIAAPSRGAKSASGQASGDASQAAAGPAIEVPAPSRRGRRITHTFGAADAPPKAAKELAKALRRWPDATVSELAKRTGMSDRSVVRHRATAEAILADTASRDDATPTPTGTPFATPRMPAMAVNGHPHTTTED